MKRCVLETVLLLNENLKVKSRKKASTQVYVPDNIKKGVPSEVYSAYREGLVGACADIVVCTRLLDGRAAVLAIRRAENKPFGGCWWMQGGAVHAYRSIEDFVADRAEAECGVRPKVEGIIGVFYTNAEDGIASTIQPCYLGLVPLEAVERAVADRDHTAVRLFTFEDLEEIPEEERHWYPMFVFRAALTAMDD